MRVSNLKEYAVGSDSTRMSYADLRQCADELHSVCSRITEILDNVSQIKERITRGECWIGKSSEYYIGKLRNVSDKFDDTSSELKKTALYLDKILGGYENVDNKVVKTSN